MGGFHSTLRSVKTVLSGVIMRMLVASSVVTQSFKHFTNWRRPNGCECHGCQLWHSVERGDVAFEDVSQSAMRCDSVYMAWQDRTVTNHWHPDRIAFIVLLLSIKMLHKVAPGVAIATVMTVGKNDMLTQYFKGSSYTAAWYVGLVDNASFSAYAAADTMASHAGWLESTVYSNGTRVAWTGGTASAGSIDNSASQAAFSINGSATIRGAFMTTVSTKGGTTGTIYDAADFGSSRAVLSGDTLNVTSTQTLT